MVRFYELNQSSDHVIRFRHREKNFSVERVEPLSIIAELVIVLRERSSPVSVERRRDVVGEEGRECGFFRNKLTVKYVEPEYRLVSTPTDYLPAIDSFLNKLECDIGNGSRFEPEFGELRQQPNSV